MKVVLFTHYNLIVMVDDILILWDSIAGESHLRLDCPTMLQLEGYMKYGTRDRVNLFYYNE